MSLETRCQISPGMPILLVNLGLRPARHERLFRLLRIRVVRDAGHRTIT